MFGHFCGNSNVSLMLWDGVFFQSMFSLFYASVFSGRIFDY